MEMKIYFPGGKKVYAEYKGFTIKTDQSAKNGGEGSAAQPFDLFLASIGTCTAAYINGFCQRRGIESKDIEIIQSMEFDPDKKLISKINMEVKLPRTFPEKYKNAVLKTASQCTVKKQIFYPPEFNLFATLVE